MRLKSPSSADTHDLLRQQVGQHLAWLDGAWLAGRGTDVVGSGTGAVRDAEVRGHGHVSGAVDEMPKPVVVALLRTARGRHGPDHRPLPLVVQLLENVGSVRRVTTTRRKVRKSVRTAQLDALVDARFLRRTRGAGYVRADAASHYLHGRALQLIQLHDSALKNLCEALDVLIDIPCGPKRAAKLFR
jgi:hypothetical protein